MTTLYIDLKQNSELQQINRLTFGYTGTKAQIQYNVKSLNVSSYWDGGSKTSWAFVDMGTSKVLHIGDNHPMFNKPDYDPRNVLLPDNVIAVAHIIFRGKDLGLKFYSPKSAPLLNDNNNNLANDQKDVLIATISLKSAYRAESLKYRAGLSQQRINQAVQELIDLGYLRKNKAITTEGKNIVANCRKYSNGKTV